MEVLLRTYKNILQVCKINHKYQRTVVMLPRSPLLRLFWVLSLSITLGRVTSIDCCCEELRQVNEDPKYYVMNDATLLRDPKAYFKGNSMLRKCGISYLNIVSLCFIALHIQNVSPVTSH